jgi:hypothetical protein
MEAMDMLSYDGYVESLRRRDLSEQSIKVYTSIVRQIAKIYQAPNDLLSDPIEETIVNIANIGGSMVTTSNRLSRLIDIMTYYGVPEEDIKSIKSKIKEIKTAGKEEVSPSGENPPLSSGASVNPPPDPYISVPTMGLMEKMTSFIRSSDESYILTSWTKHEQLELWTNVTLKYILLNRGVQPTALFGAKIIKKLRNIDASRIAFAMLYDTIESRSTYVEPVVVNNGKMGTVISKGPPPPRVDVGVRIVITDGNGGVLNTVDIPNSLNMIPFLSNCDYVGGSSDTKAVERKVIRVMKLIAGKTSKININIVASILGAADISVFS